VPTPHRRHAITETDDIKNALDVASRAWPELADNPGALLRRLVLVGADAVSEHHATVTRVRRNAVDATSGTLAGVFGADYLRELGEDWPE